MGLTETFADVQVRIQITKLTASLHVWASTGSSAPSLALSVPGRLAATTTLLNGPGSSASYSFAQKIASRTGLIVYACIYLPDEAELLSDAVAKRIIAEIQSAQWNEPNSDRS